MSETQAQNAGAPEGGGEQQENLLGRLVEELDPAQATALATLVRGGSRALAAARAGVARSTLYSWLKPGHPFCESLQRWKEDAADSARTRMLALVEAATEVIQDALHCGDRRVAMRLVEKMAILGPPPVGPSHEQLRADSVRLENEKQERSHALEAEVAKFLSGLPEEDPTAAHPSFTDQRSQLPPEAAGAQQPEAQP